MKVCRLGVMALCLLTLYGCGGEETPPSETQLDTMEAESASAVETDLSTETVAYTWPETVEKMIPETGPETVLATEFESENEKEETAVRYVSVQNPIVSQANDPWVVEHEGRYYYCRSFNEKRSGVTVCEIPSLHELGEGEAVRVYTAPEGTPYSAEYWAPELHYLDGAWYIYVAADDGNNDNHRMYVLKGTTQDPTDPFEMVGQISDSTDRWAIDGTVLRVGGEMYFVWSGWAGDMNVSQNLYIAHMSDPCTIDSERVLLSSPTYDWERVGFPTVNEGPAALYHGEQIYLVYSASGSWTDSYCLGLLALVADDPMNPDAWQKSAEAVFESKPPLAYGPGHCSFTTGVDGSVWMVYHANRESDTGWAGRSGWISPVTFSEEGWPSFGEPKRRIRFPVSVEDARGDGKNITESNSTEDVGV